MGASRIDGGVSVYHGFSINVREGYVYILYTIYYVNRGSW